MQLCSTLSPRTSLSGLLLSFRPSDWRSMQNGFWTGRYSFSYRPLLPCSSSSSPPFFFYFFIGLSVKKQQARKDEESPFTSWIRVRQPERERKKRKNRGQAEWKKKKAVPSLKSSSHCFLATFCTGTICCISVTVVTAAACTGRPLSSLHHGLLSCSV